MGSSLNQAPFKGPLYKGAVLSWGPNKGPQFRELPIRRHKYLELGLDVVLTVVKE